MDVIANAEDTVVWNAVPHNIIEPRTAEAVNRFMWFTRIDNFAAHIFIFLRQSPAAVNFRVAAPDFDIWVSADEREALFACFRKEVRIIIRGFVIIFKKPCAGNKDGIFKVAKMKLKPLV